MSQPSSPPGDSFQDRPGIEPLLVFVGQGRLGRSLAAACQGAGLAVAHMPAPRTPLTGACAPQQWPQARWVFLTVPDDAIADTAARLPWRAGQAALHCSAATPLSALNAAEEAGAQVGGFHPLQIFSDPHGSPELLAGSTVAIEAHGELQDELNGLALRLGMTPLALPAGARTLYHVAANFSASFLLATLGEALRLWERAGLPPEQALAALLPLARGSLQGAESRGLAAALSGPVARGDLGVIQAHLDALRGQAENGQAPEENGPIWNEPSETLYRSLAGRSLQWLSQTQRLSAEQQQAIAALLKASPGSGAA